MSIGRVCRKPTYTCWKILVDLFQGKCHRVKMHPPLIIRHCRHRHRTMITPLVVKVLRTMMIMITTLRWLIFIYQSHCPLPLLLLLLVLPDTVTTTAAGASTIATTTTTTTTTIGEYVRFPLLKRFGYGRKRKFVDHEDYYRIAELPPTPPDVAAAAAMTLLQRPTTQPIITVPLRPSTKRRMAQELRLNSDKTPTPPTIATSTIASTTSGARKRTASASIDNTLVAGGGAQGIVPEKIRRLALRAEKLAEEATSRQLAAQMANIDEGEYARMHAMLQQTFG